MNLKAFLPQSLGGNHQNIWNLVIGGPKKDFNIYSESLFKKPLWDFIEKNKPDKILEIGLGWGFNAFVIILLSDRCEYYCFDNLSREVSRNAFKLLSSWENTYFFIGDTKKTLPEHIEDPPKMDLIFIDVGHDYETVKNDWKYCKRLMHEDTTVWFHDYDIYNSIQKIVDEIDDGYQKGIIKPEFGPSFAVISFNKELTKN